jgi:hypothetical protein
MRLINLSNRRFGKLTVIDRHDGNDNFNKPLWNCLCDCGNTAIINGNNLKNGNTKSCGCLQIEFAIRNGKIIKHGLKNTRLYGIWHGMKARCLNENSKDYINYGGRGIVICHEWRDNFKAFHDWATAHNYADDLTIDRINNDGNYEPSNCRWTTRTEQNRNKRNVYQKNGEFVG